MRYEDIHLTLHGFSSNSQCSKFNPDMVYNTISIKIRKRLQSGTFSLTEAIDVIMISAIKVHTFESSECYSFPST